MKSKRQKTFALAVTLAGLLALAWLPGDGGISVGANGTTQEKIIVSIANDLTDGTLGSFDTGSVVNLLTNTFVSDATWSTLKSPQRIYLPLVVRN